MKSKKYRCILAIAAYELTLKQIAELKKPRHAGVPAWSVNDEYGNIMPTEFRYPFQTPEAADTGMFDGDERKLLLFDLLHASPILEHEIDQAGLDSVFDRLDVRPLFDGMDKMTYDDMLKRIPVECHVVVDVQYVHFEDGEYETEIEVVGILDSRMSLREIDVPEIKAERKYGK